VRRRWIRRSGRSTRTNQVLLLPPSLDAWLPEDHLARFVADLVDEVLDLSPILAAARLNLRAIVVETGPVGGKLHRIGALENVPGAGHRPSVGRGPGRGP
jgi:hypothetical protein